MKMLVGFFKKIFLCLAGSAVASLCVILIMTLFSQRSVARLAEINSEISRLELKLGIYEERLAGWKKRAKAYSWWLKSPIKYYEYVKIPILRLRLTTLYAERVADSSFWEELQVNLGHKFGTYFIRIFILLIFLPLIISLIMYYCIARAVEKLAPIKAIKSSSNSHKLLLSTTRAVSKVRLRPGEHIYLRGNWIGSRCDVNVKTRFMWKWNAPVITFAADLFELKEFRAENNRQGEISITAPEPDLHIGEIDLHNNRAIVIRPRYLIGVSDGVKIKTFWNFSLHNILAGKIRQVILFGSGRIFIYGIQGIDDLTAQNKNFKIESSLLIGYDAHAAYSLCRTETWWHYFRKESELFDIQIQDGVFIKQATRGVYSNPAANWLEKFVNFILNGIGSVLGF